MNKRRAMRRGQVTAERIFLRSGDVIAKKDGKDVQTATDIESAIAANPSGTIRVSGFTGSEVARIPFEREVKVR